MFAQVDNVDMVPNLNKHHIGITLINAKLSKSLLKILIMYVLKKHTHRGEESLQAQNYLYGEMRGVMYTMNTLILLMGCGRRSSVSWHTM